MLFSRSYREWSAGPVKLKKTSTANTEMKVTTIIGFLGRRVRALRVGDLKPATPMSSSNHAIILPGAPASANGPRVTFVSVLLYGHPAARDPAAVPLKPKQTRHQ
jgi:hypothetical protein